MATILTDEEWKEAQAFAGRCTEDPWTLTGAFKLHDKHAFSVVRVYTDGRRLALPGHNEDTIDDARDIETMRRLFPKLVDQADGLRAVYEAARACWLGVDPRGEKEAALDAALTALEPLLPSGR